MCVCTLASLVVQKGRGVGGLIHRAVVVIELFSLSNLNFKVLKQSKYTWATIGWLCISELLPLQRPVCTGDFCRGNSMQFLLRLSCNFKITCVNHV